MKYLLTLVLLTAFNAGFSQKSRMNCAFLKHATLKYTQVEDTSAYVVINGNEHAEYYNNGAYRIKSSIEWRSDCEWVMTMTESSVPNFPYKPGDKMTVKVTGINGRLVHYKATVKGDSWEGTFRVIDPLPGEGHL